jgi:hypothetical protein
MSFEIPRRIKQKVVTAQDAVSLIQPGDTVAVTGFVCQGPPEGILRALAERYKNTGLPNQLTLFFGGGPGDWDWRGLNHLALKTDDDRHPPMLARTLGSHYGQVPKVAALALAVGFPFPCLPACTNVHDPCPNSHQISFLPFLHTERNGSLDAAHGECFAHVEGSVEAEFRTLDNDWIGDLHGKCGRTK